MIERTDPSGESATLEEWLQWDGSAGTAADYIRALEADNARLRAEVEQLRSERDEARALSATIILNPEPSRTIEWPHEEARRLLTIEAYAARMEEAIAKALKQPTSSVPHRGYERMLALPQGEARWSLRDSLPDDVLVAYHAMKLLADALNPEGGEQ